MAEEERFPRGDFLGQRCPSRPTEDVLNRIREEALEFAGIGLYRYTFDGIVRYMDRGALRILEMEDVYPDPAAVVGKNVSDLVAYNRPPGLIREEVRKRGQVRGFECPFRTLKGTDKWSLHDCYLMVDPQTGEESIQVVVRDITERKRAEQAIERSAQVSDRLRSLLVALNACRSLDEMLVQLLDTALDICGMDGGGVYLVEGADAVLRHHGGLPEDFVREIIRMPLSLPVVRAVLAAGGPVDIDQVHEDLAAMFRRHGLRHVYSAPLRRADEVFGFLNVASAHEQLPHPDCVETLHILVLEVESLFNRLRAEEALRESEEQYRELFENANDIIYTHDLDGRFTSINKTGERLTGYTREEALALTTADVVAPEYRETAAQMVRRKLAGEEPTRYELEILAKDGQRIPLDVSTRLVYREGRPVAVQGIARDIRERRRAEEERARLEAQVRHSQKLESLGILAGGIAHDFNNLLAGILGNTGLALHKLPPESPFRTYLERIEAAAQRAAELTHQMLAYSGRGAFAVQRLDLAAVVRNMTNLLSASISKKAQLTFNFQPATAPVEADAAQIQQVIMNLITNASEALGDQAGTITLSIRTMDLDRAYFAKTYLDDDLPPGPYVCLEVSDTGCGMDKATQARIFDPFFSTKFAGRGLGLSTVLGIVRGHRGAINIYSEPGHGTTFRVLLPAAGELQRALPREDTGQQMRDVRTWRGSGVVLVADDEESVIQATREILEHWGFTVMIARDGRAAVQLFRDHAPQIRAVLLDLTMPVMNGREALQFIRETRPNVPVVLSSGYTEQDVTARFGAQAPTAFLQKPYLPSQLLEKLRELLVELP